MNSFVISHDKIIFCDDDDIMLKIPPIYEYDVISGFQYVTGFVEDEENDFNDYEKIIELTKSPNINFWRKVDDFSGYACNYKLFKEFFELNRFNFIDQSRFNIFSLQLIDLKFMKYLDNFNANKPTLPFIYHRIWNVKDRPTQQWIQNCIINEKRENKINNSLKKIKRILTIGILCMTIVTAIK
jgi:hypothetical protein